MIHDKTCYFRKKWQKICFGFALPNYRLSLERWNFNWTESLWINVIFLFDIHLSRLSLYLNRTISPKIHFSYWTLKFRNVQILFYRFANGSKTAQKLLKNDSKTAQKRLDNGSKIAQNDTKLRPKKLIFDFVFSMRLINHFVDWYLFVVKLA